MKSKTGTRRGLRPARPIRVGRRHHQGLTAKENAFLEAWIGFFVMAANYAARKRTADSKALPRVERIKGRNMGLSR